MSLPAPILVRRSSWCLVRLFALRAVTHGGGEVMILDPGADLIRAVLIYCPGCGAQRMISSSNRISADGTVCWKSEAPPASFAVLEDGTVPALVKCGCGFAGLIRLVEWDPDVTPIDRPQAPNTPSPILGCLCEPLGAAELALLLGSLRDTALEVMQRSEQTIRSASKTLDAARRIVSSVGRVLR